MGITHHVYFEGAVQSLGETFEGLTKWDFTVGIMEPGRYDFGIAERYESIRILLGNATIDGREVSAGPGPIGEDRIVVTQGKRIIVEAHGVVAYICKYS